MIGESEWGLIKTGCWLGDTKRSKNMSTIDRVMKKIDKNRSSQKRCSVDKQRAGNKTELR